MIFFIANLVISFFISLFSLYSWAKDDFILLRKNITLEQIFNYAFINVWVMLLSARIFYVFFNPSLRYINPLIFLIFIYFPGLSLTGGIIGSLIFLFFLSRKKNVPRGRLYDIFALAFLSGLVCNIFLSQVVSLIFLKKISLVMIAAMVVFLIISIIFSVIFKKDTAKDGTIAISTVSLFSLVSILEKVFTTVNKKSLLLDKECIILVILLLINAILLIRQSIVRRKR
ncbi:MAG TPA: prolipoprotein diacylglyceryl transferase family protein [Candidatus Saccharimonadales bacterium]|nr:prolipoprotein diacylglyceryl transferase family protein [Candidatus Saccharimonadales bacterium]